MFGLARNLALFDPSFFTAVILNGKRVHIGLHLIHFEEGTVLLGHHVNELIRIAVGEDMHLLHKLLSSGLTHVRFIRSTRQVEVQKSFSDSCLDHSCNIDNWLIHWHGRCITRRDLLAHCRVNTDSFGHD